MWDSSGWQNGNGQDRWQSDRWQTGNWSGGSQGSRAWPKRSLEHTEPDAWTPKRRPSDASAGQDASWYNSSASWGGARWQEGVGSGDRADIQQWRECTRVGENVPGTPIVPCKTPFEGPLADRAYESGLIEDEDFFGKQDLLRVCTERGTPVGLIIDLVNTTKYYAGYDESDGVEYRKVRIAGRQVPDRAVIEEVFDCIDDFVARRPKEFVAVHCTHGINRTGFLVSAYLMTRAHLPKSAKAVAAFEKARGNKIDKMYLLEALVQLEAGTY